MKKTLLIVYLATGFVICGWFTVAAAYRWKAPDFGVTRSIGSGSGGGGYYGGGSYGRSYGGSWGGGK